MCVHPPAYLALVWSDCCLPLQEPVVWQARAASWEPQVGTAPLQAKSLSRPWTGLQMVVAM